MIKNSNRQASYTPNTDTIKKYIPNGFYTQPVILPSKSDNTNIFGIQRNTYPEPFTNRTLNNTQIVEHGVTKYSTSSTKLSPVVPSAVPSLPSNKENDDGFTTNQLRNKVLNVNSSTTTPTVPPLITVIVTICGIFLIAALIAVFMFRSYLCTISKQLKQKSSIEKAKKSNQSQISNISNNITDDSRNSILMNQWIGPLATGNRYFPGWESQHLQITSQLSNDTSKSQSSDQNKKDKWEYSRHKLKVFNILGEGAFGQVWRCEAYDIDGIEGVSTVAMKTLKDNANESERADLLSELAVMKTLEPHVNVVRLLGCCTEKEPIFVILEYVSLGKLQTFLRNSRTEK